MSTTLILGIGGAVLGLIVGSFLNVVAHRLPEGGSLVHPPSACPGCGRGIRPWENIPIVSFFLLRGRCAGCGRGIGWSYPITEALAGVTTATAAVVAGPGAALGPALLLTWLLLALARIDWDRQILPNELNAGLAVSGALLSLAGLALPALAAGNGQAVGLPLPLDALAGGALGYGLLFAAAWGYARATGKEGMGGGDIKLLGALGIWVGPVGVPLALFLAAIGGTIIGGGILILRGRSRNVPIPFGPFLALGGWALFLWQEPIVRWYLQLSGIAP